MYSDKSINEEELKQSLPQLPTSDEQPRQIDLDPPLPTRRDLPPITSIHTMKVHTRSSLPPIHPSLSLDLT
jgi:hypothetical protein